MVKRGMASAALKTVFSIPLRHLWAGDFAPSESPAQPNIQLSEHLFATSHIGLDRFVGDSANGLLEYLNQPNLSDSDWPVVLYGETATGKTSLALTLIARATEQVSINPVYVTAVDYVRRFNSALQTNSIEDFRSQFLGSSGLVIDDIEQMADKVAAQRELVHLLDLIKCPVAITSSCAPSGNSRLLPQLSSRLGSGLTLCINPPGSDARAVIVKDLAKLYELRLSDEAIRWLADRLTVSATSLNGFLAKLKKQA